MNRAARFGRAVAGALCLCGTLLTAGCGGGKGVVSGKVSYQGKPVRGGTVSFVPEGGGAMSSPIEEDGSYTIRDVPPGTAKITVETDSFRSVPMPKSPGGATSEAMKKMMEPQSDPQRAKRYVPIPLEYSDPTKSNLTYVVKSGKQEHDIDLK